MERDFNNTFVPPYMDCMPPNSPNDLNDIYKDPFLNPMMQYEQACSYYRYLCLQMDYKMKCKKYEKKYNSFFWFLANLFLLKKL